MENKTLEQLNSEYKKMALELIKDAMNRKVATAAERQSGQYIQHPSTGILYLNK